MTLIIWKQKNKNMENIQNQVRMGTRMERSS